MENFYINIPFCNSNAKNTIYNNFNYEIVEALYNSLDGSNIPIIYNFIYRYIKSLKKEIRPIVFSPDYSVSSATFTAIAEKYLIKTSENDVPKFTSDLKIIYFTSTSHLNKLENISPQDFSQSILSNIFDQNEISYSKHNFIINPENIILVGLNDTLINSNEIDKLNQNNMCYYTLSKIKKKGIDNISNSIIDEINENPVYIIYDMSVLNLESSPSVFRLHEISDTNDIDGLNSNDITNLFDKIKTLNIVGLDITGFKLNKETPDISFKLTSECAKLPLVHLIGLKEKKINIFNEFTKILICKPITKEQKEKEERKYLIKQLKKNKELNIDIEADIDFSDSDSDGDNENNNEMENINEVEDNGIDHGWYVMRGVPTETKEELIQKLMNINDNIMFYNLEEDSMYISFTTIGEQEKKSYAVSTSIYDKVLVPDEKVNLMFSQL